MTTSRFVQLTFLLLAVPAAAQPSIETLPAECLPAGGHGVLEAEVAAEPPGAEVRLYFRRLDEVVEDFYYVTARPEGDGRYRAVLPRPDESAPSLRGGEEANPWAAWWRAKEGSDDRNPAGDLDAAEILEKAADNPTVCTQRWAICRPSSMRPARRKVSIANLATSRLRGCSREKRL